MRGFRRYYLKFKMMASRGYICRKQALPWNRVVVVCLSHIHINFTDVYGSVWILCGCCLHAPCQR
eukprot:m.335893 g.335893  ORF g.335893 m.335893 type:complete len:65 (+) comp20528_c0_seq2:610-804(+)